MRKIIAAGLVLLFMAGTALAVQRVDTQGTFLDRVAAFFGLRPNSSPNNAPSNSQKPVTSVPSGRRAMDGVPCTCDGRGGLYGEAGTLGDDGTCYAVPPPGTKSGPWNQQP